MHVPRKRFGQHFLHDPGIIDRICATIAPVAGESLVEIGPGLGAITLPLLQRAGAMDVVELDRDVLPILRRRTQGQGELRIHVADALAFDFCSLPGHPLRLVGNLPYNISTPLLFHLMEGIQCIRDMHFMLQKEVVTRLAAGPGSRDYGRLSVMIQYHCEVEELFDIGPGAFRPPPRVRSTLVRLVPHAQPPVRLEDPASLERVVARAFAHRRKTLRNALEGLLGTAAIEAAGLDPGVRPERLSLADFAALANQLPTADSPA